MDFVSRRKWAFAVSMLFIIVSTVSLLLPRGLTPGLEFTGGSSMTIAFETNIDQEELLNIQGTGKGGRVTKVDFQNYIKTRDDTSEPINIKPSINSLYCMNISCT